MTQQTNAASNQEQTGSKLEFRTMLKCAKCGWRTNVSGQDDPVCERCGAVYGAEEMIRTPRTDAILQGMLCLRRDYYQDFITMTVFARQLETEIEDAKAELARLRKERQWRPIESAPRDGTAILAKLPDSEMPLIVRWNDAAGMAFAPCGNVVWDGEHLGKYDQPTHWLPLPNPPVEGGEK